MRTVGIKTLKNELSRYIRAAAEGERVLVTDRGKIVAEIVPPAAPPRMPRGDAEVLAELERRGVLTRSSVPPGKPVPKSRGTMTLEDILRDLDESRRDR